MGFGIWIWRKEWNHFWVKLIFPDFWQSPNGQGQGNMSFPGELGHGGHHQGYHWYSWDIIRYSMFRSMSSHANNHLFIFFQRRNEGRTFSWPSRELWFWTLPVTRHLKKKKKKKRKKKVLVEYHRSVYKKFGGPKGSRTCKGRSMALETINSAPDTGDGVDEILTLHKHETYPLGSYVRQMT